MDSPEHKASLSHPWSEHIARLAGERVLMVAGHLVSVEATPELLEQVALPLLGLLARRGEHGRVLAGLAGVPGSGKSTFCALIQDLADELLGAGQLVVVGLDGWHFPNAVLDSRMIRDLAGQMIPLRQRKGAPESFDVDGMLQTLDQLARAEAAVKVPLYDRRLHDPVPGAMTVPQTARIVLVEGNYLLCEHQPWDGVCRRLRPRLFMACDPHEAGMRVIARHVRGGNTPEQALARYENNDKHNIALAALGERVADAVIHLEPPRLTGFDSTDSKAP